MKTDKECKSMLVSSAIKYGVSPALISTRLLSEDDKKDMRDGLVDQQSLNVHVEVWIESHMPEYSKGSVKRYVQFEECVRVKGRV